MKFEANQVANKIKEVYANAGGKFVPPTVARAIALNELSGGATYTKAKRVKKAKAPKVAKLPVFGPANKPKEPKLPVFGPAKKPRKPRVKKEKSILV